MAKTENESIFEPLFEFQWEIYPDYALEVVSPSSLVESLIAKEYIVAKGRQSEPYRPGKKYADLHYEFAFLVTTPKIALTFVQHFGFLFGPDGPEDPNDIIKTAKKMKEILEAINFHKKWLHPMLDRFEAGDKIKFKPDTEKAYVEILKNAQSKGHRHKLREVFNRNVTIQTTVRIATLKSDPSQNSIQVVPLNLASWLWLKVAEEIADGTRWMLCKNCSSPFPVYLSDKRTEKEHCGKDSCRQALHRAKKRKIQANKK